MKPLHRRLRHSRAMNGSGQIGRGHTITVRVQQPAVEHRVRILDFEKWLGTNGKSPAEMMLKSRLRSILGGR